MRAVATSIAVRLTQLTKGGGCACRTPPGALEDTARGLQVPSTPGLLVGLDHGDDAAVEVR